MKQGYVYQNVRDTEKIPCSQLVELYSVLTYEISEFWLDVLLLTLNNKVHSRREGCQ